ncbi:alginate export family protein [Kordiimonas gwangyangensis]|uniref:alginate export family protein n=1 Tax=Kordiimonas gwangyangensis TaxID=288022 RepID=UPI0012DC8D09|nr:alginate export family protein [Kordiimonas gwangyangensis]
MKRCIRKTIVGLVMGPVTACSAFAEDVDDLSELFQKGDASLDFRYRLELVEDDAFTRDATASTLLTRLSYGTASYRGFSAFIEAENITPVGGQSYNSTTNGKTHFPVVADPETTELNQAYLAYRSAVVALKFGRQGINHGNQRFIGTVGFRQNDQTYDAVSASLTPLPSLKADYSFVWQVNRIFGHEHPLGTLDSKLHFVTADYSGLSVGKLSAYAYLFDFNDISTLGLSSATYGVRFAGEQKFADKMTVGYEAEYARQKDHGDNPLDYSADYWRLGASFGRGAIKLDAALEELGSDGGISFKTPLATLHKFNGWADKFLTTPAAGLRDLEVGATFKVPGEGALAGLTFRVAYHDFRAASGSSHYGSEWDFLISKKISKSVSLSAKAAFYEAKSFARDTKRMWLTASLSF